MTELLKEVAKISELSELNPLVLHAFELQTVWISSKTVQSIFLQHTT